MRTLLLGSALLGLGATAIADDARACGFIDYREIRMIDAKPKAKPKPIPATDLISAAEQRLEGERPVEAGALVLQAFPRLRMAHVGDAPLETHGMRLVALATVRSDGNLAGVSGFAGASLPVRNANLAWAVSTLRAVAATRPGDPVANADLGEALAAVTATEDEARLLLSDLSQRDLIGSAHAYAALARLEVRAGNAEKTHEALARCQMMSKAPAVVCRVPEAHLALL